MTGCPFLRLSSSSLSRFTPLFLFRRIAFVSARPFSRLSFLSSIHLTFPLFPSPSSFCFCFRARFPVQSVTSQLLYEPVTSPNGATSLLLISSRRALFHGRASIRSSCVHCILPFFTAPRKRRLFRKCDFVCHSCGRMSNTDLFSVLERARNIIT